ncbi:MAG TPA: glycosyltransferase family 4 protein [Smithellaceae bacterium]|nr:glycosyltransferase family 4 protein [Smithellaceae bacterium]
MRILLLVVYYLPSTMSSAKLIHDLAIELQRMGHEPVVVAPDENLKVSEEVEFQNGIKVLRVRSGRIKTASRLMRGLNESRLSEVIWKRGRRFFKENPCDLIIYYSPTIFFGTLVKRLKKLFRCPSYLILRDIFPQWAVDSGILQQGIAYRYLKLKERQNYEAADIIGVQSPANLSYFKRNGLHGSYRLEVLYNWAALNEENTRTGHYRERLGLQGKIVFFYGGNMGVAQDMDNILRLAENMRHEKSAYFLLVGDGSEVPRLKTAIASKGLSNISVNNGMEQQEYLSMLSEFDVGLISLDRGLKTQNFPGKMLGYMYHSMPILASINPGNDLRYILQDRKAGLVCMNGEDNEFAENAGKLLNNARLRLQLGKNARSLLESMFSVTGAAVQILGHFENLNKNG